MVQDVSTADWAIAAVGPTLCEKNLELKKTACGFRVFELLTYESPNEFEAPVAAVVTVIVG